MLEDILSFLFEMVSGVGQFNLAIKANGLQKHHRFFFSKI